MKIKIILLVSIVVICANSIFSQPTALKLSSQDELKAAISLVPCKNEARLEAVKSLFKKMGASEDEIKTEKIKDIENLTVLKKGKSDEIIIIGAHYDKVKDGCGAIDNWTGIVLIASIYRTLKDLETEKSYIFVAFDKEEPGLFGSGAMAKAIPKEKRGNYCSMVNFDSFGLNYPQVLENSSSKKMTDYAEKLAKDLNMPFTRFLLDNADADSSSFKSKDIPAVTFSGLSAGWERILHSSNDKIENIKIESVYIGYQFALRFISRIDVESCAVFRNQQK